MRVRSRGRDAQRLLGNKPAARAKETSNAAQGPYRIGLVHQEQPRIGQIKRAAQRCGIQFVEVTYDHLDVAQLKGRHHRPRPLHRRRVEIDAHDPPAGPDHLCQDRKAADGSAPAVDRLPPWLDTEPAECRAGHLRADLSDTQEPPEVFISAVEDVTPEPLCDCFSHAPVLPTRTGVQFSVIRRKSDSRRYTRADGTYGCNSGYGSAPCGVHEDQSSRRVQPEPIRAKPRPGLLCGEPYSAEVQQRPCTAPNSDDRQHTQLAGRTAKRPAAPLVRDEEAVPAACPIDR